MARKRSKVIFSQNGQIRLPKWPPVAILKKKVIFGHPKWLPAAIL